jgi:hypothetical protein
VFVGVERYDEKDTFLGISGYYRAQFIQVGLPALLTRMGVYLPTAR